MTRSRRGARKMLIVAGSVAVVWGSVATVLLSTANRPPIERPWVAESCDGQPMAVGLLPGQSGPGEHLFRLRLRSDDAAELLASPELRLMMATYQSHPRLVRAELREPLSGCTFVSPPAATLWDNHALALVRSSDCPANFPTGPGAFELAIWCRGTSLVGLWSVVPASALIKGAGLRVAQIGAAGSPPEPVVRGAFVQYPPPTEVRKVDLLNYMWQLSPRTAWLWAILALAAVFAGVGGMLLPIRSRPGTNNGRDLMFVTRTGFAAACFGAALAATYAILVPPLAGPDEPNHLEGYSLLQGTSDAPDKVQGWFDTIHMGRLRFQPDQRFTPENLGKPYQGEANPGLDATNVAERSETAAILWRVLSHHLGHAQPPLTLAAIRFLNVLIFSIALLAAGGLVAALAPTGCPQLLVIALLAIPTLPFFATHASDHALLCSTYLLLASVLVLLPLDGRHSALIGVPLGLTCGLLLASGRGAGPLLVLVVAALVARLALGAKVHTHPWRSAAVFWVGLSVTAGIVLSYTGSPLRQALSDAKLSGQMTMSAPALGSRWYLVAAVLVLVALQVGLPRIQAWAKRRYLRTLSVLLRPTCGVLAFAVVASLAGSLLGKYPHVPDIQEHLTARLVATAPAVGHYAMKVAATLLTSLRLRNPDIMTYVSFWGGFGWIDTIPPNWFLLVFSLLTAVGLVVLLLDIAVTRDARRLVWLLALGTGWIASAAAYAYVCYQVPVNVHGRYLIGWWLTFAAVAWSPISFGRGDWQNHGVQDPAATPTSYGARIFLVLAFCGLVHAYCLCFILNRYF